MLSGGPCLTPIIIAQPQTLEMKRKRRLCCIQSGGLRRCVVNSAGTGNGNTEAQSGRNKSVKTEKLWWCWNIVSEEKVIDKRFEKSPDQIMQAL